MQEHVYVARGEKVLTAGEAIFKKKEGAWTVDYVNNRSNGYFPAKTSFCFFESAAKTTGLQFEMNDFSEKFPKEGYLTSDFLCNKPFYDLNKLKRKR